MSDLRMVYAPLLLLITISAPSYGQVQGTHGRGQGHQGQSQGTRGQPQGPQDQGQAGQDRWRQGQGQGTQGQSQGPVQQQRRQMPGIQTYRGPQDYRVGLPPSRDLRRRDRSRDLDRYRHEYRAQQRFRIHPYVRPRGWYQFEWTLGGILPRLFWPRNYWIVDYWIYGLPIPPYDCVWVRYENDAILIDRRTGKVIEVIYDVFFW